VPMAFGYNRLVEPETGKTLIKGAGAAVARRYPKHALRYAAEQRAKNGQSSEPRNKKAKRQMLRPDMTQG